MSYCTRDDIEDRLGRDELVALTDLENTGEVNDTFAAAAIADADAVIDGYVSGRYGAGLSPAPTLLKNIAITLAEYYMHDKRGLIDASQKTGKRQRYEDAINMLKAISNGTVTLGADATPTNDDSVESSTTADSDFRTFVENNF